jgi:hypothetical protein
LDQLRCTARCRWGQLAGAQASTAHFGVMKGKGALAGLVPTVLAVVAVKV